MTEEEYFVKKEEIENEISDKLTQLDRDYAEYHSPAEVGDIVSDCCDTIIVEEFTLVRGGNWDPLPSLLYTGPKLTKKGVPFKNGEKASVFQEKIQRVIKKDQK